MLVPNQLAQKSAASTLTNDDLPTTKPSSTAIVIVNHNTSDELRACLDSLKNERFTTVIVVDTASSDDSVATLRREYPWVSPEALTSNVGYGAAANRGVANCTDRYVLLLNADTVVVTGAVASLEQYLRDHPKVGVAGPRLLNTDGTIQHSCFPFPGTLRWCVDNDGIAPWLGRLAPLQRSLLRIWDERQSRKVPWVKGAAFIVRRDAFDAVGGFDESYFMYFEETDLCRRLERQGWEVHFTPDASIIHHGGSSAARQRTAMTVQLVLSMRRFCSYHYSATHATSVAAAMWLVTAIRLVRTLTSCLSGSVAQRQSSREIARGYLEVLFGTGRIKRGGLAKRTRWR